ncbi:ABC transporter substrate-binding protein [Nesterenkonia muleiensis]|uniref:ABC transporter substrate-binding protein n=1 Tax=Nesterenkonia muleiensis TaxID=2282648 RepID=UPI000E742DF7|nr:ABC transporter substrate-binding protein [Nesterenkonia muleiensis]
MTRLNTKYPLVGLLMVGLLGLISCGNGDGGSNGTESDAEGAQDYVEDGTFIYGLSSDVGSLDPHFNPTSAGLGAARYAYDPLVHVDSEGELSSGLAEEWELEGDIVTFTLRDDVTCDDGSDLSASMVKENLDFIGNPENASPLLGTFVPPGAVVEADDEAGTVTLTLAGSAPFVVEGLANVMMVCDAGLADREALSSEVFGTGPYELAEAAPGDRYTYERREGYAWGPGGISNDEPGMPADVQLRVIENETTAANLLLSGEINAASILGPDAQRLESLFSSSTYSVIGQQWYNQTEGHATQELEVREALTQALDLDELMTVFTGGEGARTTQLAALEPTPCNDGDFTTFFPETDPEAANEALEAAGWELGSDGVRSRGGEPLEVTFIYDTSVGAGGAAASELAVTAWEEVGVQVEANGVPTDEISEMIFGGGSWDVVWVGLNVNTPDQLVGMISGPSPLEGGQNFSSISNEDYDALVAEAMDLPGGEGCGLWFQAEEALISQHNLVPFANDEITVYANGAEFEVVGLLQPTSIRLYED